MDSLLEQPAQAVASAVAACAWQIERKFSRYRDDNIVARINNAGGRPVEVDEETARLLDFADAAWRASGGKFDITSGVLRRAWKFDGHSEPPSDSTVEGLLRLVGWHRARWEKPMLTLEPGMEIDFGGIGKEYAVDLALAEASRLTSAAVLVNFGGDLAATGPRRTGPWKAGIESVAGDTQSAPSAARLLDVHSGALATSGDTYRYVNAAGERLSHILDPRTGRPVRGAPRTITVAAATCSQAGLWCTLAMLEGPEAGAFLDREGIRHWIQ